MNDDTISKYFDAEQIDNDTTDEDFDEIYEVNNSENEYEDLKYGNSSNEPDSDPDIDFPTDMEDDTSSIPLYPNGSITLCQAYARIKAFIIKCNLIFRHTLYLISLLVFLLSYGYRLTRSGTVRLYNPRKKNFFKTPFKRQLSEK